MRNRTLNLRLRHNCLGIVANLRTERGSIAHKAISYPFYDLVTESSARDFMISKKSHHCISMIGFRFCDEGCI